MNALLQWSFERIFHARTRSAGLRLDNTEVWVEEATERAVDRVHQRLRLVSDYKARLRPAVLRSLEFVDRMAEKIPGGLEIGSRSFGNDPRVSALFSNAGQVFDTCRNSAELRAYYEGVAPGEIEGCWALMSMKRIERTVFGVSLHGDVLHRDVPQTILSFSDHSFCSPSASERETREGVKDCLFGSLIECAFERISECKASLREYDAQRRILGTRLRRIQSARKAENDEISKAQLEREAESLQQQLQENEQQLMQSTCSGPEECIETLGEVLGNPEKHMRLQETVLRIDRMGVKVDEPEATADEIRLAELELGTKSKRVMLIGRLPSLDFGAHPDLIAAAGRYLGV